MANQLTRPSAQTIGAAVKIKIKLKLREHSTEVRTLITHPMHSGRLKDSTGALIPAHYIQEIKVEHNDKIVALCITGSSVSKNPFLKLRFKGGVRGDRVRISWVDNKGERGTKEQLIP